MMPPWAISWNPNPGSTSPDELIHRDSAGPGHSPFSRPGLTARTGPFALVAVAAEASLVLPPGTRMGTAVIVSLVLLTAVALAFLLRIFAAGLKLQGVLSLAAGAEVRHRVESSVFDLDDAIRLLRQAIFGLERRLETLGPRQQVPHLCAGLAPVPEITFTGPVDDCLPRAGHRSPAQVLRMAFGLIGPGTEHTSVDIQAAETLIVVVVTGTGPGQRVPARLLPAAKRGEPGRHRNRDRYGSRRYPAGLEPPRPLRYAAHRLTARLASSPGSTALPTKVPHRGGQRP